MATAGGPKQQCMEREHATSVAPPPYVALVPGESIVLPAAKLNRVFLGLGWSNISATEKVDLDCSVVGYAADGVRDEASTVWFGKLHNGSHAEKPSASSIVHTGDILTGSKQGETKADADLERIYVWMSALPAHLETVACAVDVFTKGQTFASLSNAYCRLVNADTGQELARLTLTAAQLGPAASSRVMLLARLRRLHGSDGLWALETSVEARPRTLREESGPQADMTTFEAAPVGEAVTAADVALGMPVGSALGAPAPKQQQQAAAATTTTKRRRGKAYLCPALAVGTAAGVGAATAIFLTSDASPLSASMLSDELFSSGVSFAPGDLELMPDMSAAGDFFGEVGAATGDALGAVGDAAGDAIGAVGEMAGAFGEAAGEAVSAVGDAAGVACGVCCHILDAGNKE